MVRNPRGDTSSTAEHSDSAEFAAWSRVLAHRAHEAPEARAAVVDRFKAAGLTPAQVESHLRDAGDLLYGAATSGPADWTAELGGDLAVALLAAEVGALMQHLVSRAASVRAVCVDSLLDEYSAVSVAGALGVARQKVYELGRAEVDPTYITTTPWRLT